MGTRRDFKGLDGDPERPRQDADFDRRLPEKLAVGMIVCGALLTVWLRWWGPTDIITESGIAAFLVDQFPVVLGLLPSDFDSVREFFR